MGRIVLLDAGVIGLLTSRPTDASVVEGLNWLNGLLGRVDVALPDLAEYEVRRELLRLQASKKLERLDALSEWLSRVEVTREAFLRAAEFWALTRMAGIPTAHPEALDADAILAGVAVSLASPGSEVTIATTNVRHLQRFPGVDARHWRDVR